ncbi:DUF2214 family protein [Fulvivirga sp. M361]|uniref:DUF2214 family protein n=1 Tax=Fulvivirga sp. M361 TaxID=2594266 RepID=UPI00117AFEF9|nr:DUF2214 family protein [Fulvivirga sp. M361]TRX59402.1 DUF2214 family protein [Fulvivirga sp. M361]
MEVTILVRYLHFIGVFTIVSCIVAQHLLIAPEVSRAKMKRLLVLDRIYGVSSIVVVMAGLSLWFWLGKPAEYYSKNWILYLKVGLFIIVGVLSIIPTRFFSKHHKGEPDDTVVIPGIIKKVIRIELLLMFLIPLLATLMASGKGYFGE